MNMDLIGSASLGFPHAFIPTSKKNVIFETLKTKS
jgi:hypothetical protein